MATYLARYLEGEYEAVWNELIALGEQVRQEPVYSDAKAVAYEIMRRVRANVELLIPRLQALGYRFKIQAYPNYKSPLRPPVPNARDRIAKFEADCTLIPVILHACCEILGDVDFRGDRRIPGWNGYLDELMIRSEAVLDRLDEWGEYEDDDGNLYLDFNLFPCPLHKINVSGLGPVYVTVPNGAVDAPLYLDGEPLYLEGDLVPAGESLVNYLRSSILRCGGFQGILFEGEGNSITHLDELIKDLIPF